MRAILVCFFVGVLSSLVARGEEPVEPREGEQVVVRGTYWALKYGWLEIAKERLVHLELPDELLARQKEFHGKAIEAQGTWKAGMSDQEVEAIRKRQPPGDQGAEDQLAAMNKVKVSSLKILQVDNPKEFKGSLEKAKKPEEK